VHYPTKTVSSLIRNNFFYISVNWINISPMPCVYVTNIAPIYGALLEGVYAGTVTVGNMSYPKDLNIYSSTGSELYLAFDSKTLNLEVIYYHSEEEDMIGNWNPTAPPAAVFAAPATCYAQTMFTAEPQALNPLAPNFPNSMTMYTFDGFQEIIYYYDGVNQMWRIDTPEMGIIQRGGTAYMFLKTNTPSPSLISPLPCYQYAQPYSFIPDLPSSFTSSLGTATMGSTPLSVWAAPGHIWYFDSTNTPMFFFQGPSASVVSFFQSGTVPSGVFDPPAFCLSGIPFGKPFTTVRSYRDELSAVFKFSK